MVSGISSPPVSPYAQTLAPAGNAAAGDTNASGATLVAANAHREASGSLSIVTKEGDTVTLSASLEADATYASARTRGASATYLSLETSSSIEIKVQGDLSDKEMEDIQKLVKQFSHELRQFFRGSDGADATDVGKGDFSSLTGFAVHFDASRSLTVVAATTQGALPTKPPAATPLPPSESPANPAEPENDGDGDDRTNPAGAVASAPAGLGSGELSELVGKLLHLTQKSGLDAGRLNELVGKLFDTAARPFQGEKKSHVLDHVRREVERGVREGAGDERREGGAHSSGRPGSLEHAED